MGMEGKKPMVMKSHISRRAGQIALVSCTALSISMIAAQSAKAQDINPSEAATGPGDIIVTARRAEERLQDVPISITVFKQEDLAKRNVAIPSDLAIYTPSLAVNQRFGPEKSSFSIRGFNQDVNTAPTVGVYFAEVVGLRAQGGNTSGNSVGAGAFTDLANVQVLNGPQGTLFGRNTTGGAILLTPQKPTDQFGGYAEGTYGNYNQVRLQGVLNIPISDSLKIRLTGESNHRDGYMKNVSGIGAADFNDVGYAYGRLSILANLAPNLENYTVVHYSESKTNSFGSRIVGCATPSSPVGPLNVTPGTAGYNPARFILAQACAVQLARQTARGDSLYDVEDDYQNPFIKIRQWQAINTTTWQASDHLTVKNIMSYGQFREQDSANLASSNFTVPNINGQGGFDLTTYVNPSFVGPGGSHVIVPAGTHIGRIALATAGPDAYNATQSTFTDELQFQGKAFDDRLTYVVGGYLEFSRPQGFSQAYSNIFLTCSSVTNLACANPLGFGSIGAPKWKFKFNNNGIYSQATFKFTDQLSLTGGLRYTFDSIKLQNQSTNIALSTAAGSYIDPRTGVSIRRTCQDTLRHPNTVVTSDTSACDARITNNSSAPTWVVDLEYKPTPDLLFYAKYARGYRQGGISPSAIGLESWKPETMDSYEAGAKFSFRGPVSGYFNMTGFYNNLRDKQIYVGLTPTAAARSAGFAGGSSFVLNAAKARSYGIEIDAAARFFERVNLSVGYTYLNTKILDVLSSAELAPALVGTPFATAVPQVASGTAFTNAPKNRLTVTAAYELPLDKSVGDVSIGATWVYTSKQTNNFSDPAYVNGYALGVTPANNLVNLNLDWKRVMGSQFDLALFVTNLTKEAYNLPNQNSWLSSGVAEVTMSAPRFYGLRLRYNFGS